MKFSQAVQTIVVAATTWIVSCRRLSPPGLHFKEPVAPSGNSTCSDWTSWIPPRTDPAIIMQVVSEGYLPVQKNFIALIEANSGFTRENIFLICLDEESEREVALMGIRCAPLSVGGWKDGLRFVWQLRVRVLSCLLEAGHSVILSDSDALWLKDPTLDFDLPEVRGSSIVASRGSFPGELGGQWGSTLCMGFIFFRAGPGVNTVLVDMERLVMKLGDDQKAINYALDGLGIEWDMASDMRYILSTDFGKGTVAGLDQGAFHVTLLPHNKYTRKCDQVSIGADTAVAHCHSKKQGPSKIAWMREENLWVVDDEVEVGSDEIQKPSTTSGADDSE